MRKPSLISCLVIGWLVHLANADVISHWTMDGSGIADLNATVRDTVGQNHGTVINEALEYVPGPPDSPSALLFEQGTQDKIDVLDDRSLQFDLASDSFTLETVFRVAEDATGRPAPFSKNGSSANDSQYWARVRADQAGGIQFLVRGDGGDGAGGVVPPERIATTRGTVTDGLWHHFAAVYQAGESQINLYLDYGLDTSLTVDPADGIIGDNVDGLILGGFTSNSREFAGAIADVRISNAALTPNEFLPELNGGLRPTAVAGNEIGTVLLEGVVSDVVMSEPQLAQGLAQYWFDGNMRGNVDAFLEVRETGIGTDEHPLIAGPFASDTTWWAGSRDTGVISDLRLPSYPAGLRDTRFDGSSNSHEYGVRLTGEIFIQGDGEYLIRDGIDDFAMIAIDQDGNGMLDELATVTADDVGLAGFGDVLVLDDDWANIEAGSQSPDFHGIAEFENVGSDGEWRKIEIWMSEGRGGDSGIVYMGRTDDPDIFDETITGSLTQEERDVFVVRNEQLRATVSVVESATSSATLRDDVEHVVQVDASGNDQFTLDDKNGVYNTVLDVNDVTIRIQQDGELEDGTTITLFDVDTVSGFETLNLLFDDPSQWDLSQIQEGQIVFGSVADSCNADSQGDLDGSGNVDFADFLVLSNNFGATVADHSLGDIDCNGTVEFADFLVLSSNFGTAVGATSSVPEASSWLLLCVGVGVMPVLRGKRTTK